MTRAADMSSILSLYAPEIPSIFISGNTVSKFNASFTINNYSSYSNTALWVVTVANTVISTDMTYFTTNGYISFIGYNMTAASNVELKISITDAAIGKIFKTNSEPLNINVISSGVTGARYIRYTNLGVGYPFGTGSWGLSEFAAYSGADATGTKYTGTAAASYAYSGYPATAAVDNNLSTMWWGLAYTGNTVANNSGPNLRWQTDLGSNVALSSIKINTNSDQHYNSTYSPTKFELWFSNTGAFTGEHTVVPVLWASNVSYTATANSYWVSPLTFNL